MRRFTAKTVFFGLVRACRLAIWPTRRSPLAVKPTIDGVVRAPSWLGMTWGAPPSITATHEFVVPRSMPITLPTPHLAHVDRPRRFGTSIASVDLLRPGGGRDLDQRGAQEPVAVRIPFAVDLHHRAFGGARNGLVGERLMTLGIERPALGVVDRDALGFEDRQQLAPGQLDALAEGSVAALRLQRPVEVVENGDEGLEHRRHRLRSRALALALHALSEVLELGPAAEQLLLQLVPLAAQRLELLAAGGREGLDVDAGQAGLLGGAIGGGRRRGLGGLGRRHRRIAFVLAMLSRHVRSSCRVRASVRATWSTRAITRAYSI